MGSPRETCAACAGGRAGVPGCMAGEGCVEGAAGAPGTAGAVLALGATCLGALCFCHASQRSSAENEKTTRAMRRWVSIMIGKESRHRVEAAVVPGVTARDAPERQP